MKAYMTKRQMDLLIEKQCIYLLMCTKYWLNARTDMTFDVCCGRKTTAQQQQQIIRG